MRECVFPLEDNVGGQVYWHVGCNIIVAADYQNNQSYLPAESINSIRYFNLRTLTTIVHISGSHRRSQPITMSDDEDTAQQNLRTSFGTGIRQKPIEFVRAGSEQASAQRSSHLSTSAGDRYLSIVFKNGGSKTELGNMGSKVTCQPSKCVADQAPAVQNILCEICKLPLSPQGGDRALSATPHEATITHMVCMEHSHPPSYLDRNRQGLKYLSSYGWDPDSRLGLGAAGKGIRAPIKARPKHDTVGLGVKLDNVKRVQQKKVQCLNAKQARKKDLEDRKKRKRLQEMFYRNDDVERYLGGG